jgi:hypothetical protein
MRWIAVALASLALVAASAAAGNLRVVSAHGLQVSVPASWHRLEPTPSAITDPRTLLVVGTAGVGWNLRSACQNTAYRVPVTGAVVVVLGWTSLRLAGSPRPTGRASLSKLIRVSRPIFECSSARGAGASVVLRGKAYQVDVMVGDRTTPARVAEALAVARSFDVSR